MRAFGHELFVRQAGKGGGSRRVLCLHSSGQNHRQWRGYIQSFSELDWDIYALDFIGCGRSEHWRGRVPFHFSADVAAVVELARAHSFEILVGHSYGGAIALQAACHLGGLCDGISVFDPVLWGLHYEIHGEHRIANMAEAGFFDEASRGTESWMAAFVGYWQGLNAWQRIPESGRRQMMADASQTFDQVRSIVSDWTTQAAYSAIRAPALVVNGNQTPPEMIAIGKRAAEGAQGTHVEVEGGHLTPLIDRPRFDNAITSWWRSINP